MKGPSERSGEIYKIRTKMHNSLGTLAWRDPENESEENLDLSEQVKFGRHHRSLAIEEAEEIA